jgi:hypothetical protein
MATTHADGHGWLPSRKPRSWTRSRPQPLTVSKRAHNKACPGQAVRSRGRRLFRCDRPRSKMGDDDVVSVPFGPS